MNTSVFYIKGISSVYWNLEQAIKEAKLRARCAVIDRVNYMKNSAYDTGITIKHIEDCALKYRVTVSTGGSIKVKAIAFIPYVNNYSPEEIKNATFSKTYSIYALPVEEREEGITFELPFTKK